MFSKYVLAILLFEKKKKAITEGKEEVIDISWPKFFLLLRNEDISW